MPDDPKTPPTPEQLEKLKRSYPNIEKKLDPPPRLLFYHLIPTTNPPADELDLRLQGLIGSCDAAILHTMTFEQGDTRQKILVLDGRTGGVLPAGEIFAAWGAMAKRLAEDVTLKPSRRICAQIAFDMVRELLAENAPKRDPG